MKRRYKKERQDYLIEDFKHGFKYILYVIAIMALIVALMSV